jgi:uncharacterized protein YprB with RNaseH-like and TPR domain
MMREDLRRRLRELGVVQGVRELQAREARRSVAIEDLVSGGFHTTSRGRCFVAEASYPLDHAHGDAPLSAFLELSPRTIARMDQNERVADVDLRSVCFLDTETTGLSGGTGTMAFVVGLGFFEDDQFRLEQFFLRDPGDEPAMVEALMERFPTFEALVSFNGRAFDVPIIENRFILARVMPPLREKVHVDLLHPARRLWRYALSSCALTSLERDVLGVRRQQADVPSGVIPFLYRNYLQTGDARDMKRVLYHNQIDILSMVTLATRLCGAYESPWRRQRCRDSQELGGGEFYALGRWYADEGRTDDAERAYRSALRLCSRPGSQLRTWALRELAYLLKRDQRREEAFGFWQQLALESSQGTTGVLAHIELAKYLEWYVEDLERAAGWTRAAIERVEAWRPDRRREGELSDLRHRLSRLQRKLS